MFSEKKKEKSGCSKAGATYNTYSHKKCPRLPSVTARYNTIHAKQREISPLEKLSKVRVEVMFFRNPL